LCVLADEPILHSRVFEGLGDTLRVLESIAQGAPVAKLQQLARELDSAYDAHPTAVGAMKRWLDKLATTIDEIAAQSNIDAGEPPDKAIPESETAWWTRMLVRQFKAIVDELDLLCPWTKLGNASIDLPELTRLPTLRELAEIDVASVTNGAPDVGHALEE